MMEKNERSCFHCKHRLLCCLRHAIEDVTTKWIGMLDIDPTPATTETYLGIINATARACRYYEFKEGK